MNQPSSLCLTLCPNILCRGGHFHSPSLRSPSNAPPTPVTLAGSRDTPPPSQPHARTYAHAHSPVLCCINVSLPSHSTVVVISSAFFPFSHFSVLCYRFPPSVNYYLILFICLCGYKIFKSGECAFFSVQNKSWWWNYNNWLFVRWWIILFLKQCERRDRRPAINDFIREGVFFNPYTYTHHDDGGGGVDDDGELKVDERVSE